MLTNPANVGSLTVPQVQISRQDAKPLRQDEPRILLDRSQRRNEDCAA
jgi:hypothetical protein